MSKVLSKVSTVSKATFRCDAGTHLRGAVPGVVVPEPDWRPADGWVGWLARTQQEEHECKHEEEQEQDEQGGEQQEQQEDESDINEASAFWLSAAAVLCRACRHLAGAVAALRTGRRRRRRRRMRSGGGGSSRSTPGRCSSSAAARAGPNGAQRSRCAPAGRTGPLERNARAI